MKNLKASSGELVQAMMVKNQEDVNNEVSTFVSEGEWVEFTAWSDSAWSNGESPSVPPDIYNGHAMPEGSTKVFYIPEGDKIAVNGRISISW